MHRLGLVLACSLMVVLAQQRLLLGRAPRLLDISAAQTSSGPGALDLRFSRPMAVETLGKASRLHPSLPHQWLGSGSAPRLLLKPGGRVEQPLDLFFEGADQRGMALPLQRWRWDPRPRMVAVVPVPTGEQVRLREHDGRWRSIGGVWPSIPILLPLGDGSALAMVTTDATGAQHILRVDLIQGNLAPASPGLMPLQIGTPRRLSRQPLLFAHLSSNRTGDLLAQSSRMASSTADSEIWPRRGGHRLVPAEARGPIQLVPQGGAMVVPESEGLSLRNLPGNPPRRQMLPGNRDLSSFCPSGGRAVLVHHRPDYTRSLELVEPGQPPRQLWNGTQALVATACDRGGERIWALMIEGTGIPRLELMTLNREGKVLAQRRFAGWELEPGTGVVFDPTGNQLLLALRPLGDLRTPPASARAALIDADDLTLRVLPTPVRQVLWLPSG